MIRYPSPLRLDIGCGWKKKPGHFGVDFRALPNVDLVLDIARDEWPFENDSAESVRMSHILEHIPPGEAYLRILREVHRVLKPGGEFFVEVPKGGTPGAWADPTHVRAFESCSFNYLDLRWYWWGHYRMPPFDVCRVEDVQSLGVYRYYMKKVSRFVEMVIPSWNNHDSLYTTLASVMENTNTRFNAIVVDNGSTPSLLSIYEGQGPLTIIPNETNLGWVKAINQGISITQAPYVLFLNDDIQISHKDYHWLDRLIDHMESDPACGAVGPTSNFVLGTQSINPVVEDENGAASKLVDLPQVHDTNLLIGFCLLVRREALDEVGGLDERFGLGGNDDLDYSIRLRKAGWKMKVCRDVYVHHYGCRTTGRDGEEAYNQVNADTRKILIDKWGEDEVRKCFVVPGGRRT